MKGFKITSIVLTPGNYEKYSREELTVKRPGFTGSAPVTYNPKDWRPPAAWYKKMKFPVPAECIVKPGPKKGSAERTSRLEIRCQPELLQLLDQLTKKSWYFTGWTRADVLHELVRKAAMSAFPDAGQQTYELIEAINPQSVKNN